MFCLLFLTYLSVCVHVCLCVLARMPVLKLAKIRFRLIWCSHLIFLSPIVNLSLFCFWETSSWPSKLTESFVSAIIVSFSKNEETVSFVNILFLFYECNIFSQMRFFSFLFFPLLLVSGFYLKGILQVSSVIGCLFIHKGGIEAYLKLCIGGAFWLVHFTKWLGG